MSDSRNSRGGAIATRGLLVQALAALLDITHGENAFTEITLEPLHGNDKFDFLWKNERGSHAKQVKSTENSFTKTDVERWANELKKERIDEHCSLVLIGNIPPALAGLDPIAGVVIETKNLDLPAFIEQAAQRLAKFLERENLPAGTGEQRETVVHALESKLQHYATEARTLTREEFIRLLRTWIGSIPKACIAADISSIIKHAPADLIGREDEMKLLHEAWAKVQSQENGRARVLTFVALGGEGKTSLVAKWAAELADQGWPGCEAVFAWSFYSQGMRESASSDLFLKEALTVFGDAEMANSSKGAYDKGRRLAQLVGERRALLILDGVEPLQYAPTSPTPGELKDQGVAALLRSLSSNNHGLCIVTTRYEVSDLRNFWQTTAPQQKLLRLSKDAGVALLKLLGVNGTQQEFETLVEDMKGHALTLNLLGSYIHNAHAGDIRKRNLVEFEEADAEEQGGHAFRIIEAYVQWFQQGGDNGHRAVAVLRCLGLFDRPMSAECFAVLQKSPAISGIGKALVGMRSEQINLTLTRLEKAKLVSVNRDASGSLVSLDAHPVLREYFAKDRLNQHPESWRIAHQRLYKHLCETTKEGESPTLEDLQPLYQAVAHGCKADLYHDACLNVYIARIIRGFGSGGFYSTRKLGAFSSDLAATACFFDTPWHAVSSKLEEKLQVWLLNAAAFSLRALGRLTEAITPLQLGIVGADAQEDWENAAIYSANLSELELALGKVTNAIDHAKQCVNYADRSTDKFRRMQTRTTLADTLHQAGLRDEATARFEEAEALQVKRQPGLPWLYSAQGFQYCDLLLSSVERIAWKKFMIISSLGHTTLGSKDTESPSIDSSLSDRCLMISDRASYAVKLAEQHFGELDIALDQLTLGRADLYSAILKRLDSVNLPASHLDEAASTLRRSGQKHFLPMGLLSRAWLRQIIGVPTGPESAQADLDECWEIAERGPMPLFLADIHLHHARLFFREAKYPWESPQHDLAEARRLIFKHGYLRRKEELEDAEAVVLHRI